MVHRLRQVCLDLAVKARAPLNARASFQRTRCKRTKEGEGRSLVCDASVIRF